MEPEYIQLPQRPVPNDPSLQAIICPTSTRAQNDFATKKSKGIISLALHLIKSNLSYVVTSLGWWRSAGRLYSGPSWPKPGKFALLAEPAATTCGLLYFCAWLEPWSLFTISFNE